LKKEWNKIFKEWKPRNESGARTSGAAEEVSDLDIICQQIADLKADAAATAKSARRSSFQAPRQADIDSMINSNLSGRARLIATNLAGQMQEARDQGDLGEDSGEMFTPAAPPRQGRGGGARTAAKELADAMAISAKTREAAQARADELARQQLQIARESVAAQQTALLEFMKSSEADRRADREQQARKDEEDRKERAEERKEMFALIARAFSER
jgi:hypothetical protein